MTPVPVVVLLAPAISMELAIVSVPFAEVYAVSTVFAVIPLMIVTMIAIVVAMMIPFVSDYNFLRSARLGCCYGSERRRKKKET
jgi:putative Mn2+ efflux pump MntP